MRLGPAAKHRCLPPSDHGVEHRGFLHVAACLRRGVRKNIEELQDEEGNVLSGATLA